MVPSAATEKRSLQVATEDDEELVAPPPPPATLDVTDETAPPPDATDDAPALPALETAEEVPLDTAEEETMGQGPSVSPCA